MVWVIMSGKTCIEQHHADAPLSLWIYRPGIILENWYVVRKVHPINGGLAQSPIPILSLPPGDYGYPPSPL